MAKQLGQTPVAVMGSRRLQDFLSDSTFTDCSQTGGGGELNGKHLGKEEAEVVDMKDWTLGKNM